MGAGSVVVDDDVDAFGNLEGGGVLFGFRQRRTKHVDLLSELRGARSASTKEAVAAVERTAHCGWVTATDPERWGGLLERFGLHSRAVELPEAPGEGHARLRPADLHQPQSFREASNEEGLISFECREHPACAAGGKADLDVPMTELILRADPFGEVDRIVQGADEDGASQPQSLCASRGEGHEFERSQGRCGAKHGFLRPGTVKAQGLGSGQVVA